MWPPALSLISPLQASSASFTYAISSYKSIKPKKASTKKEKSQINGHWINSKNFTNKDTIMLVHLMDNHKPIGPQEWLALEKEYNK